MSLTQGRASFPHGFFMGEFLFLLREKSRVLHDENPFGILDFFLRPRNILFAAATSFCADMSNK